MKLKTVTIEGKEYAVIVDGKPVYEDGGKDVPFDAPHAAETIKRLNGEAKGHREAKEAAETKLKAFEGITDVEAAKKALETVADLDTGKLLTAGKGEEIRLAAEKAAKDQMKAATDAANAKLAEWEQKYGKLEHDYHGEKIATGFGASKFIADKLTLPGPAVQPIFAQNFKVEDGKVIGYDSAGQQIYSKSKPGSIADFDEALEILVDSWPYKDTILKGANGGGSGGRPGTNGTGGKTITRAAFDGKSSSEKATMIREGVQVTD